MNAMCFILISLSTIFMIVDDFGCTVVSNFDYGEGYIKKVDVGASSSSLCRYNRDNISQRRVNTFKKNIYSYRKYFFLESIKPAEKLVKHVRYHIFTLNRMRI